MDSAGIEKALVQQMRVALEAYRRAAADHRSAIEDARARRWRASEDGHQALYRAAALERLALERYVQVLKALTEVVASKSRRRLEAPLNGAGEVLTPRESEVLRLIATGLSSREIGGQLKISLKTVIAHRYQLMRKLDLHDVVSLVRYAVRKGLVNM